jgi:cob(I)alamin adenosyltransferase
MGHRLSRIYTRTGDDGTTGLANGERIDKADPRVAAFGDVDETNSALGVLLAEPDLPPAIIASLGRIQHELFEIGAELSLPGYNQITGEHVTRLEQSSTVERGAALEEFVLPRGRAPAADLTICRSSKARPRKLATLNPELRARIMSDHCS